MCREEKIKHKKRMRKLENLYRHNLRRMRKTLEVKLEKSATVLEEQREERKKKITECVSIGSKCVISNPSPRNCCLMQVKREQAQSLKQELEEGLERWRQQVGSIVTIISPKL